MKIYIESSGCTRRKLDVSKFHTYFKVNGYDILKKPDKADYILVTTCAFKKEEEDQSVALIEKLGKNGAKVVVYGCLPIIAPTRYKQSFDFAYLSPKQINEIDNHFENIKYRFANISDSNILRNSLNHSSWASALNKFVSDFEPSVPFFMRSIRYAKSKMTTQKKEYYLFTSRGCLGSCSYCAVRFAVGTIRSKPQEEILREFREGIKAGYRDFVLLGDDVGAYGLERGESFPGLLSALVAELDPKRNDAVRLHIDEFNPRWLCMYKDSLMELFASKYVASILCPIQSGSDRVLGLMDRGHDIQSALSLLDKINEVNPGIRISTQIIVGFPTETDEEFHETLRQLGKHSFDSVMLFPYDEKENTKSVEFHPKISEEQIRKRTADAQHFFRSIGIKTLLSCNEQA